MIQPGSLQFERHTKAARQMGIQSQLAMTKLPGRHTNWDQESQKEAPVTCKKSMVTVAGSHVMSFLWIIIDTALMSCIECDNAHE